MKKEMSEGAKVINSEIFVTLFYVTCPGHRQSRTREGDFDPSCRTARTVWWVDLQGRGERLWTIVKHRETMSCLLQWDLTSVVHTLKIGNKRIIWELSSLTQSK